MTQHKKFKCPYCKRELTTNRCVWCLADAVEKPSIPMGILYGRWGDGTLGADWWYDLQAKMKKETISRAEAEGYELVYEETDFMMFKKKE